MGVSKESPGLIRKKTKQNKKNPKYAPFSLDILVKRLA